MSVGEDTPSVALGAVEVFLELAMRVAARGSARSFVEVLVVADDLNGDSVEAELDRVHFAIDAEWLLLAEVTVAELVEDELEPGVFRDAVRFLLVAWLDVALLDLEDAPRVAKVAPSGRDGVFEAPGDDIVRGLGAGHVTDAQAFHEIPRQQPALGFDAIAHGLPSFGRKT
ncbi:MAG: hypothetical protein WC876_09370 [Candidatus Thermoplasmatota archaeon]